MIANNVVNPPAMGVSKANRLLAVMCYVGIFVVPLLVLRNTDKEKNPFLHSHAAQALEIQYWTAFTVACVVILDYVINPWRENPQACLWDGSHVNLVRKFHKTNSLAV